MNHSCLSQSREFSCTSCVHLSSCPSCFQPECCCSHNSLTAWICAPATDCNLESVDSCIFSGSRKSTVQSHVRALKVFFFFFSFFDSCHMFVIFVHFFIFTVIVFSCISLYFYFSFLLAFLFIFFLSCLVIYIREGQR